MSNPSLSAAVLRGLKMRCPHCGEGPLFGRYLKVASPCEACGHDNAQYPADDGPAYITILLVGHLIVAPLLIFHFITTWPVVWVLVVTLPLLLAATLIALPRIKGGFIGLQCSIARNHDRDAAAQV
jgi:uncharacterized protein (DUF983 family)